MDPSIAKERVDAVVNKEQYFKDYLYGYGTPRQATPADASIYTGRVYDVAQEGIPYGVPRKLLPIFTELNKNFINFKESHKKMDKITNDAGGYDALQSKGNEKAKAEFAATFNLYQKFKKDVVDYNNGYLEWMKTSKNPAEIIKSGSMELKIFSGGKKTRKYIKNGSKYRKRKSRRRS